MEDTIGRNINYLRVSITDLCNLRCKYCMPEEGVSKKQHQDILSFEELYEIAKTSVALGVNKIRITGGEPLVRKGVIQFIQKLSELEGVKDLALTTNGVLLKRDAYALKQAGLGRVNISLDTLNENKYREITRGGNIRDVLKGIEEARKVGLLPIKLNVVLIGGFNDDEIEDFIQLTTQENLDVRFIELMPIGQASSWTKDKFVSNHELKEKLEGLIPVFDGDKSSPAKYYRLPEGKGRVGFINPISNHFCKYCNRIRLTADGKIKPCLHTNQEIDVKEVIRKRNEDLEEVIRNAIHAKPAHHNLNQSDNVPIDRDMIRIGG